MNQPRWNLDNPTPSSSLGATNLSDSTRTPTPSRRGHSHQLSSSFFAPAQFGRGPPTVLGAPGASETKQTSFEWPILHVRQLLSQLESGDSDDQEPHQLLDSDKVFFDDLAYQLHIEPEREDSADSETERTSEPNLLLAVVARWTKDLPEQTFERQLFAGIKQYEREGQRGLGEPQWLWSTSGNASFSHSQHGQNYWEVKLPPLSTLLQNDVIAERDAFAVRVVIKHASEPGLPPMVHSDQQFISRRVTRQVAGLLDSPRSADIRFVCLEHAGGDATPADDSGRGKIARRRVVYAHSELLVHTDYFKATLRGSFAEATDSMQYTTLIVDDASFNTIYWVLRWLYTDEILFTSDDSARTVMAQVHVDNNAARRLLALDSWDYSTLVDDEDESDIRTVRSGTSESSSTSGSRLGVLSPASSTKQTSPTRPTPATSPTPIATTRSTSQSKLSTSTTPMRGIPRPPTVAGKPPIHKPTTASAPAPSPKAIAQPGIVTRQSYSASSRRSLAHSDPHHHPTEAPKPPSPLAVYILAHRYGLEELQALAKDALLRNLTPDTCMSSLLATYSFDGLHIDVQNYVYDNWSEVSTSPELDRCYQEVSAGVWGETDGGHVLLALTRRLTHAG